MGAMIKLYFVAGKPGVWNSDAPSRLYVDAASGSAQAMSAGPVTLTHNISSQATTSQVRMQLTTCT